MRCVFSTFILFEKYNNSFNEEKMLLYTKYKDWLSIMKERYAYFCGADYILYENDDEFKEFAKDYNGFISHDIAQYYKMYQIEKLSKTYNEILYLDFDVIIGKKLINFFDEHDLSKGLVIKEEKFNLNEFSGQQTRMKKAYWAYKILESINNKNYNISSFSHYNTGIMGFSSADVNKWNFFELLESFQILNTFKKNKVQYYETITQCSDEVIFILDKIINYIPIQPLSDIWHKKANGVKDLDCVFLHCTGKKWIDHIFNNDQLIV